MSKHTWFITGISSGIGRCMSELLLQRGDQKEIAFAADVAD